MDLYSVPDCTQHLQNNNSNWSDSLVHRSLSMALSIRSDWYTYLWLIYCKIYSAIIKLAGNHCRRSADKAHSVITAGTAVQSPGGLQRVRAHRRRRTHTQTQQHSHLPGRVKHIVALTRRSSIRRIVMAPGSHTAQTMLEDKEKTLHGAFANGEYVVSKYICPLSAPAGNDTPVSIIFTGYWTSANFNV